MAAWNILTDTLKDLYNKFGSPSQSQIQGANGATGTQKSAKEMYALLNIATNRSKVDPVAGNAMSDFDGVDNVAWNVGPSFNSLTSGALTVTGTIDGNGSRAFYNFQVLSTRIGAAPSTDWGDVDTIPIEEGNGAFFKETGWLTFLATGANAIDRDLTDLINGEEYYCRVMYHNGFNSLTFDEWDKSAVSTLQVSTITLNIPQISTFVWDTLNNEFDASWIANGNDASEFDNYEVTISITGNSQTFLYANDVLSVTNQSITNFFPSPGQTVTMEIKAIDAVNTNSGVDTDTEIA